MMVVRRFFWMFALTAVLFQVACSKTITQDVVGQVSVTVAADPDTIQAGPMVLHVQLADREAIRPLGDVMITAMAGPEAGPLTKQVVVPVATPGASEVRLTMPESGILKVTFIIRSETGTVGQISYILESGKSGVRRLGA